jgi:hypothetical protein
MHHNLFAHTGDYDRAPLLKMDTSSNEVINNVIYNWYWGATRTMSEAYISRNHYIPGTNTGGGQSQSGVQVHNAGECPQLQPGTVMVSHNIGPGRLTDTGDDWLVVQDYTGSSIYRTNTPSFTLSGVTEDAVTNVKTLVLAGAGSTVPTRDSVDVRIVNDVNNGTGHFINSPSDVGGWPTIAGGTAPIDTDGDGMPDAWETAHGLNPNIASDAKSYAPSGYIWIEEYINGLFPPIGSIGSPLPPPSGFIPNPPTIIGIN